MARQLTAVAIVLAACGATARAQGADPRNVQDAIARGQAYLLRQITPAGPCKTEFPEGNVRFGGKTGLLVYAALAAGVDEKDPPLSLAISWLTQAELAGTYARAMRACALAELSGRKIHPQLTQDVAWLIAAARGDGAYSYTAAEKTSDGRYDNSNSHAAVMGVWAAMQRGVKVPDDYWRRIEKHWRRQQQPDGGWGYVNYPGALQSRSYGSMTASGMAALYHCFDVLHRAGYIRPVTPPYAPLEDGLKWLDTHYTPDLNPRKGVNYYYSWLHALSRVGAGGGHKHFAGRDWQAECTAEVLERQNSDGSWANGDRTSETALAVLFLVSGRRPVLISKLHYTGKWNVRPRDAAAAARYVQATFERGVSWQVIDAATPETQWRDAPMLYISGAGRVQLPDDQIAKLRAYALGGGLILSESAGNSGAFTLDMHAAYKKMFPEYSLHRLPPNHPVYTCYFAPKHVSGLWGISNGVRLLAIHAPRELSLALQLGPDEAANRSVFELISNLYILQTDRGNLPPRGTTVWPPAKTFSPVRTLRIARVSHPGNWNPEPLAWTRLALLMGNDHRIALDTATVAPFEKLSARTTPIAVLTGTDALSLTAADRKGLARFITVGGTLLVDAAGGSAEFTRSVREQIVPAVPDGWLAELPREIAYSGPEPIDRVYFRRQLSMTLGASGKHHRLQCVLVPGTGAMTGKDRAAVILSAEDLTSGLLGIRSYAIAGYRPPTAVALMTNLLTYAADAHHLLQQPAPKPKPTSQPTTATAPASKPAPPPRAVDDEF